jgi:hypothetical protein
MVMGKNAEVAGETDPTSLADEVKNQNKQLIFFCMLTQVGWLEQQ